MIGDWLDVYRSEIRRPGYVIDLIENPECASEAVLRDLDAKFSVLVRMRAGWRCEACGRDFSSNRAELHCSHFWSRWNHAVRFDLENCDAICASDHEFFGLHRNEFKKWKRDRLSDERYEALRLRSQKVVKVDRFEVAAMIAREMEAIGAPRQTQTA